MAKKLDGKLRKDIACCFEKILEQQLYGHLPPITQTIQEKWAKHAEHFWWNKDKLITDVL